MSSALGVEKRKKTSHNVVTMKSFLVPCFLSLSFSLSPKDYTFFAQISFSTAKKHAHKRARSKPTKHHRKLRKWHRPARYARRLSPTPFERFLVRVDSIFLQSAAFFFSSKCVFCGYRQNVIESAKREKKSHRYRTTDRHLSNATGTRLRRRRRRV